MLNFRFSVVNLAPFLLGVAYGVAAGSIVTYAGGPLWIAIPTVLMMSYACAKVCKGAW
jgi:hypothetical protein